MANTSAWVDQIRDRRGGRVVFLAHCLLNENTRYLGGAGRAGAVREVIDLCLAHGVGTVQLPCPEQHAWGGVHKRWLLWLFGSRGTWREHLRRLCLPGVLWYTRRIYRRLAREVAGRILDYQRSGLNVLGVVGVDASPTCGVRTTLDIERALDGLAGLSRETVTAEQVNAVVRETATAGRGMFVEALDRELRSYGVSMPFVGYDLVAELAGRPPATELDALVAGRS